MAETSRPWGGTTVGDAGPYSDDDWSDIWRKLFTVDRTTQGVLPGYAGELVCTTPVANTLRVATGAAVVDGKFYENTANVDVNVPTPAGATRIDRIVLRKSWAAQTVRITRIAGAEGGGAPAVTQTDGTTWDLYLCQVSITIAGAMTVTDERRFCQFSSEPRMMIIPLFTGCVGTNNANYVEPTDQYNSQASFATRTVFDKSKLPPNATITLRATLRSGNAAQTVYAELYNRTDGAAIAGSELSHTGDTVYTETASGDLAANLPSGSKTYALYMKSTAGFTGTCSKAYLLVEW